MQRFHRLLLDGLPKDESLRRAMAQTAARAGTSHPYYWAGFLLSGDPAPLVSLPSMASGTH